MPASGTDISRVLRPSDDGAEAYADPGAGFSRRFTHAVGPCPCRMLTTRRFSRAVFPGVQKADGTVLRRRNPARGQRTLRPSCPGGLLSVAFAPVGLGSRLGGCAHVGSGVDRSASDDLRLKLEMTVASQRQAARFSAHPLTQALPSSSSATPVRYSDGAVSNPNL